MKKEEKQITSELHRVSPRTMLESQNTLLRNNSGWLLPTRSIIRKKIKQTNEVIFNGTLM